MNVSVTLITRIIKNDQAASYKMRKRQYLAPVRKRKRLDRAKVLRTRNHFSDEKIFTIEASVNNQNDRVYSKCSAVIDECLSW